MKKCFQKSKIINDLSMIIVKILNSIPQISMLVSRNGHKLDHSF